MKLEISDTCLLTLAVAAIKSVREDAEWIGVFNKPTVSESAKVSMRRIAARRAKDLAPVIKAAVGFYGAELFRRRTGGGK